MLRALKASFLLFAFAAAAPQQEVVEITSEPGHHLVLDNMFIRAFDVTVPPKATTLVHRHNHDYIFVTLGDSDITNAKVGAAPARVVLKDGEARFTAGGFAHAAINNLDRPFRNITIELLAPATNEHSCTESCTVAVPCKSADNALCPSVTRLLMSDQWTVTSVIIPPGGRLEEHTHYAHHLAVAVSDLHLKIRNQDQPETEINSKVGDLTWVNPVVHTVTNTGPQPARIVTLEFRGTPEAEPHQHP